MSKILFIAILILLSLNLVLFLIAIARGLLNQNSFNCFYCNKIYIDHRNLIMHMVRFHLENLKKDAKNEIVRDRY